MCHVATAFGAALVLLGPDRFRFSVSKFVERFCAVRIVFASLRFERRQSFVGVYVIYMRVVLCTAL